MLGHVLMTTIFEPFGEGELFPEFFLTEESKRGLNEALKVVLLVHGKQTRNVSETALSR